MRRRKGSASIVWPVQAFLRPPGLPLTSILWQMDGAQREAGPRPTEGSTERMTRKSIAEVLEEARRSLDRMAPHEAYAAMRAGALLIDVRCESEREARGRVPGAVPIPLSTLEWRLDPDSESRGPSVSFDQLLVLLCAQGYSSSLAAMRLQDLGFERATDVDGGFEAWKASGLPIE
jgi:rhodanese-related sulfurtransferase